MDEIMKILTVEAIKPVNANEDLPAMMVARNLEKVISFKNFYSYYGKLIDKRLAHLKSLAACPRKGSNPFSLLNGSLMRRRRIGTSKYIFKKYFFVFLTNTFIIFRKRDEFMSGYRLYTSLEQIKLLCGLDCLLKLEIRLHSG